MSLPSPPYVVKSIDSPVEQDQHGNSGAFITLADGTECLLRMKGVFPIEGDTITDRVLVQKQSKNGNTYLKLEKPAKGNANGSQGASKPVSQDGPDEAYWAGQNAAKGRAHAQEMAVRVAVASGLKVDFRVLENQLEAWSTAFKPIIDWFYEDVQQAKEAVEKAAAPAAQPTAEATPPPAGTAQPGALTGHDSGNGAPPSEQSLARPSHYGPTDKQLQVLLKMARERGLDGAAMSRYLKAYCKVESFSELPKQGCVDAWAEALKRPDPQATDIPVADDWPPTDLPAPSDEAEDSVPF